MSEISNGNPLDQNRAKKTRVKKTNFPIHIHKYATYRFGEYGCIGVFNGIANDSVKMRQIIDVNTYSLKAPLLTPITMNRVYTQVPRMAILPNAWNLIFTNPSTGDDIDATKYGTSVDADNFESTLQLIAKEIVTAMDELTLIDTPTLSNITTLIQDICHALALNELVFSNGSLINTMGAHLARLWPDKKRSFDQLFDKWYALLKQTFGGMTVTNTRTSTTYVVQLNFDEDGAWSTSINYRSLRYFIEELRDGEQFTVDYLLNSTGTAYTAETIGTIAASIKTWLNDNLTFTYTTISYERPFDIARLWAYQLSCAEFFTNDKVDYIYNAELFRKYIGSLLIEFYKKTSRTIENDFTFSYNGSYIIPDWLSARTFTEITSVSGWWTTATMRPYIIAYLFALLKYNRSLKYKDYFTGARTRPIAIGNTNVEVNSDNEVEIIDVVANIQKQRFLNIVNKIPRDIKGYTKGIFGKDVAPDWHNPLFLAKISEAVYGQETENTGEAQITQAQSRTSVLKNEGNRVQVEFNLDRDSIIVGFVYFDIPRAYSKGIERSFMDVDRFDFFNPYMQYTGDQEVYKEELDAKLTGRFGYQGAYMDKKQMVNDASGGFIEDLKGWTFLDAYIEPENMIEDYGNSRIIGPDFIRSRASELDRFYISLTGNSMSKYFHFIMDIETHYNAVRPMAYNPQILG